MATATLGRPALAKPGQVEVFKSPTCGCCSAWVDHMASAGFDAVARDVDQDTPWPEKDRAGVAPELSSCHTAFIDGYFVEGYVPASDVQRLLSERPDALDLTVPGMPTGSPGMEMGNQRDTAIFRDSVGYGQEQRDALHPISALILEADRPGWPSSRRYKLHLAAKREK
ncbi:MAG: DUF411 domain-containing protein [Pseudomonadota bacterium]